MAPTAFFKAILKFCTTNQILNFQSPENGFRNQRYNIFQSPWVHKKNKNVLVTIDNQPIIGKQSFNFANYRGLQSFM